MGFQMRIASNYNTFMPAALIKTEMRFGDTAIGVNRAKCCAALAVARGESGGFIIRSLESDDQFVAML